MRLSTELINELITEIAGEETVPLADFLRDKVHISEFKLADKLELTVNQVRNLLYRLDEHNLVSFMRKKDKKKGWYEYYWTLNFVKIRSLIIDRKKEKMSKLRKLLKEEREQLFYRCPNGCIRVSSEEALDLQFKCSECDEVLQQEDTMKRKDVMNAELKKLLNDVREATESVEIPQSLEVGAKKKKKLVKKKPLPKKKGKKKSPKPKKKRFKHKKKGKKKPSHKKLTTKKPAKKLFKPNRHHKSNQPSRLNRFSQQRKTFKPKKKQFKPKKPFKHKKQAPKKHLPKQQPHQKPAPPQKKSFMRKVRRRFFRK